MWSWLVLQRVEFTKETADLMAVVCSALQPLHQVSLQDERAALGVPLRLYGLTRCLPERCPIP
jgi:hypothetical protein